jgi:hypothetical protein
MKKAKFLEKIKQEENQQGKLKTCSKCGEQFRCKENNQCWCSGFAIQKTTLEKLKNSYRDCLCPECLKIF